MKTGKITFNGVILMSHELATVVLLAELGFGIILIPKSNKYGEHSPDIKMLGLLWEIKYPKGEGKYLIQNTMRKAARQSENIIIDLRRAKLHQSQCLAKIEKRVQTFKAIQKN